MTSRFPRHQHVQGRQMRRYRYHTQSLPILFFASGWSISPASTSYRNVQLLCVRQALTPGAVKCGSRVQLAKHPRIAWGARILTRLVLVLQYRSCACRCLVLLLACVYVQNGPRDEKRQDSGRGSVVSFVGTVERTLSGCCIDFSKGSTAEACFLETLFLLLLAAGPCSVRHLI